MALKAYKHLTDGEVKIVESGSAEETALLADTVKGASYLQLTSAGHSQEVAAAQGSALWVDVTSDLGSGGGGSSAEVFELAAPLVIPSGTDWSTAAHQLGSVSVHYPYGLIGLILYIELDEAADVLDFVGVQALFDGWDASVDSVLTQAQGQPSADIGRGLVQGQKSALEWEFGNMSNLQSVTAADRDVNIGIYTIAPTTADITVVRAYAELRV